jgi:hypothetical protein
MSTILRKISGGVYDTIQIEGTNRNTDIGLYIKAEEPVSIRKLVISNVFIPLVLLGNPMVTIEEVTFKNYGGDAMNIRASNLLIKEYTTYNSTPTRPYSRCKRKGNETVEECLIRHNEQVYDSTLLAFNKGYIDGYHVDTGFHAYAVKEDGYSIDTEGSISNITIHSIDVDMGGSQGIMCSEACNYSNFNLGLNKLRVVGHYVYPIVFNSLADSTIGGINNTLEGKIRIAGLKGTVWATTNNNFIGFTNKELEGVTKVYSNLEEFSEIHNIELAILWAIIKSESDNKGFYKGNPRILFERHKFTEALRKYGLSASKLAMQDPSIKDLIGKRAYFKYGTLQRQQDRFKKAYRVHKEAAIEACSWGKYQILGSNWKVSGFEDVFAFHDAQFTEEGQLLAFLGFLENNTRLMTALQNKDWKKIKRYYNGVKVVDKNHDGKDDYVAKLIKNYTIALKQGGTRKKLHKSRTMRNNTTGAVVKVGVAEELIRNGDVFSKITEQLTQSRESVTELSNQITTLQAQLGATAYTPYILGGVLLLALYPHFKVMKAYLEDNGYL